MPIPIITQAVVKGVHTIPYAYPLAKAAVGSGIIYLLKRYFGGAVYKHERPMHSKVIMVTGGTSGIGAFVVRELALSGAQIILLTQHPPSDPFIVDYVEDLRTATNNELIYVEQCDLSSLHSVRLFATKWINNKPVRRLDMVLLLANTAYPKRKKRALTVDGLDEEWQVNYLANYHLLSMLSPALRAQPPDRDVRIILANCSSYMGGDLSVKALETSTMPIDRAQTTASSTTNTPKSSTSKDKKSVKQNASKANTPAVIYTKSSMYSTSKLALTTFAHSFQAHLASFERPDKHVNNAQVLVVDPGLSRTPGTRRWLTNGSLWGLFFYLITWPIWWLVLKSPEQGAQSFLMAAKDPGFTAEVINAATAASKLGVNPDEVEQAPIKAGMGIAGRKLIKECKERDIMRDEVTDQKIAKELWEFSQKQIEQKEKEGAVLRALEKKEREAWEAERKREEEKQGARGAQESEDAGGNKQKAPGSRRSRKAK